MKAESMPIKVTMLKDFKDNDMDIDLKIGDEITTDDVDPLLIGNLVFRGYAEPVFE